jgi:hypothetical protein
MNNYFKYLLTALFCSISVFILLNFSSCDDGPTEPNVEPGRRDYTWEVDTLNIPFTYLYKLWGSSPKDVWAVGPGGGLDRTIWHYNGNNWKTDGISRAISPQCIYGFNSNNVWIAGADGKIWNFDGNNWSENFHYINDNLTFIHFKDIWGETPGNIYAIGFGDSSNVRIGLIMNYNGKEWTRVNVGFNKTTFARIRKAVKTSSNYFIWGVIQNNSAPDSTKIFEFNGSKLKVIHSDIWSISTGNYIQIIDDEIIFTIGNKIYIYHNNAIKLIVQNSFDNYYNAIAGRNRKDILWLMSNGLTHYNGFNFKYLFEEENIDTWDLFTFSRNIFVLANDEITGNVLIYKGTLN